ncbi:MAG: hypothetical protein ACTS4U_01250 [Candidatus Hodgkinia cicadicola]
MRLVNAAEVSAAEGCDRLAFGTFDGEGRRKDAQLVKWVDSWSLGVLDWLRTSPGGFGFQGTKEVRLGWKLDELRLKLAQSAINCRA